MKKLLLICILLIGVIFISGCINEENINSKTSTETNSKPSAYSQTSEPLIKPSDLPKGYYSTGYETRALSQGVSFEIPHNLDFNYFDNIGSVYEGDIPPGKKRTSTILTIKNEDLPNNRFIVYILELDSESRLKEYVYEFESSHQKQIEEARASYENNPESKVTYNSKKHSTSLKVDSDSYIIAKELETNLIGDNSVILTDFTENLNTEQSIAGGILYFTSKNYLVMIHVQIEGNESRDILREEVLKVAKVIENRLD